MHFPERLEDNPFKSNWKKQLGFRNMQEKLEKITFKM